MKKLVKLFRDPALFFEDAARNRRAATAARTGTPTYVVGFSTWKQYMRKFFPDRNLTFLPREISEHEFNVVWSKKILSERDAEIFIWGFKAPPYILQFIKKNNVKVVFAEDGFVRSVQLGASKAPPMSLCLDSRTPYFNAREASDLELLLQKHDFAADAALLARADTAIKLLVKSGVSKYNHATPVDMKRLYGAKNRKRVLVIGQVEDDASIEFGCEQHITNNDLVRLAAKENPGAQIIYKPHPDVLAGHRDMQSNPEDVAGLALLLRHKLALAQALETVDHVYTITSLAGFEALLRGIKVTTMGAPFYAGWGLTDDRQATARRQRKLTLRELFAGAYLLYPRYFDPNSGEERQFEDIVALIASDAQLAAVAAAVPTDTAAPVSTTMAVADVADVVEPVELIKEDMEGLLATYLVGDNLAYRDLMSNWFDERGFVHIPGETTEAQFTAKFKQTLDRRQDAEFFISGDNLAPYLRKYIAASGKPVIYLSEGPLRSVGVASQAAAPYSLLLDRSAPHYDARHVSSLEEILSDYDFDADTALMERAVTLQASLVQSGLNKYNHSGRVDDLEQLYGIKDRPRVLVLGQVEATTAFKLSNPRGYTNNDLVTIAAMENPGAHIIFKPHPNVLNKLQKTVSNPAKVAHLCQVLDVDLPLAQALETVDKVYTISSLGGFEALLRGMSTTTLGLPFYAGWGLGDDRQTLPRRSRTLTVQQVFAAAYVLYPVYVDSLYKSVISPERAIERLSELAKANAINKPSPEQAEESGSHTPVQVQVPEQVKVHTFVLGDVSYKSRLNGWFADRRFGHIPSEMTEKDFTLKYKANLDKNPDIEFFIASAECPSYLVKYANNSLKKVSYLTEGFLCSVELESAKYLPYSLLIDGKAPHYDAQSATDLEEILATHPFASDANLMARAALLREKLLQSGLSKRNHAERIADVQHLYGAKNRTRILVLGQVEDSIAFKLSNPRGYTNNELVTIAAMENPGAQIIFKPAPEILQKLRKAVSNPAQVTHLCQILDQDLPLAQALETVDHVYTISSLGGFEALLRGIKTTTLGLPFYAGWRVGDDRNESERRTRKLTVDEVFAAAYLLYPMYVDPLYKTPITAERAIDRLMESAKLARNVSKRAVIEPKVSLAKAKPDAAPATLANPSGLPEWYRAHMSEELRAKISEGKPLLLYLPGTGEEDDNLVAQLKGKNDYILAPFDMINGSDIALIRPEVLSFAEGEAQIYRQMVMRRLIPLKKHIKAFIFTCDLMPVVRLISSVCEELGIHRILIPSRGIYLEREKFYMNPLTLASVPTADVVLAWGNDQRDIFVERGYPAARIEVLGTPKLDKYSDFSPDMSRKQYYHLHGLNEGKKTILFVGQSFSEIINHVNVHESQSEVIESIIDHVEKNDLQMVIRLAKSEELDLTADAQSRISNSSRVVVSNSKLRLVDAAEAVFHSDVVISINSTVLLEAALLKKRAVSINSHGFETSWEKVGVSVAKNENELFEIIDGTAPGELAQPEESLNWAAQNYSNGKFDGKATKRVMNYLNKVANDDLTFAPNHSAAERILSNAHTDVVASHIVGKATETTAVYVQKMLKARSLIKSPGIASDSSTVSAADVFVEWGIKPTEGKIQQRRLAKSLGRPVLTIEDGFIRSVAIGLSGEAGLSIIIDDTTAYYDATIPSRLQRLLEEGPDLTEAQIKRSRDAMEKIVTKRVSKYNHALDIPLQVGTPGRKKVLLVDQRFGDQSVESGLADERSYERMLYDAVRHHPDCDIIVKQHPDAISGGKSSYFSNERLAYFTENLNNIYPIRFDVNPFALFDLVDDVYAVTSGMGFEALMAGKNVHCYGAPFYAGWGATTDQLNIPGRSRRRNTAELFHFSYIECSRYFNPDLDVVVEVEDLVDYIAAKRGW